MLFRLQKYALFLKRQNNQRFFMLQRYNISKRQWYVSVRFGAILHDLSISVHLLTEKKYYVIHSKTGSLVKSCVRFKNMKNAIK